jgi:hypothetical protein
MAMPSSCLGRSARRCEGFVMADPHSLHSARREKIIEAWFSAEILRELWCREVYDAELLHSDIDAAGYDLVLSRGKIVRHIQLKSVLDDGKAKDWPINGKLADKPSGCVVLIKVQRSDLNATGFYWFGNPANEPCNLRDLKRANHTRTTATTGSKNQRLDTFKLPISKFTPLMNISEIVDRLLG